MTTRSKRMSALAIDAKNYAIWYGKGRALLNLKRYDEALEAFQRSADLNSQYAPT
jgi:tetratricopeptide (TPR) repeat protein